MGSGEKSFRNFHIHLPHLHLHHHQHQQGKKQGSDVPKGCLAIKVGSEGEEQQRFVVPVIYFNHPLFMQLLKEAEEEYGFDQKGAVMETEQNSFLFNILKILKLIYKFVRDQKCNLLLD
ncbi:hypothetical protein ES288_D08G047000v1 [Gossypium darwinii]|uniref:Auxin-responsive protein SAUR32 n=1 Tax=Gossypium darwinii TaxID=34276 RepID=A0A5D2BGJ6_GOSDA|nr:hypothetical protein ES288_D08G047000v1 [Gossypium darwinii]